MYTEAVEQKAQNWELIHSLQEERTLNGAENLDSLSSSSSLSQSLFSLNSLSRARNGLTASNDSLPSDLNSTLIEKQSIMRTLSGGVLTRMCPNQLDYTGAHTHWLQRTSSLSKLQEMPESDVGLQVTDLHSTTNPDAISKKFRSMSVDIATQTEMYYNSTAELYDFRHSPTSDDSSTESETLNRAVSPLSTSSLSHEPLERLEVMDGTGSPMKRDSTGSMSSAKSPSPSSQRKLKSILRTSSSKIGVTQTNNVLPPASTILHTILPAGSVSSTSEESDTNTNPPSPKVEVVQCHTTERKIETGMGPQRRSGSVQFNVTFVESGLMSEETKEKETMQPEEETVTDADKPETSVSLEEASRSFPKCEPQLLDKSLSSEATSEQQTLISERSTKNEKQNQSSEKSSPKHKVMFSPDTRSSSPTPKQRNKSTGSINTYSSTTIATRVGAKHSTVNSKHHDSESSKYQTWRGKPDLRRSSFPHTTRVEVQRTHLSGTKPAKITPIHKRLTGRGVRELSQMFEIHSDSTKPTTPTLSSGSTKPTTPTLSSGSTKPTTPTLSSGSTKPTLSSSSTKPTTPTLSSGSTKPTTPTLSSGSTKPTLSSSSTKPTTPTLSSGSTKPTLSSGLTKPTTPTLSSGSTKPTLSSGSTKPTTPTLSSGSKSVSSRVPLSACGKHAGSQILRAQRLGTEVTDGPMAQRFNSTSTSSSDTEKRRTPTHSRLQSVSKLNAHSGTESTQRKLRTKSETLSVAKQGILKQRPNGTVDTWNSSDNGSQTRVGVAECVNSNSNNNCHQRHSLSLASRGKQRSGVSVVRFSEGQSSRQTRRHLPRDQNYNHGQQILTAGDKC